MSEQKDRKFWRDKIDEFFKSRAMKLALAFISAKASWLVAGPMGWLTNIILSHLWNALASKALKWAMRKGALVVDKRQGKIRIKKINKAKDENNDDDYWDTISDI